MYALGLFCLLVREFYGTWYQSGFRFLYYIVRSGPFLSAGEGVLFRLHREMHRALSLLPRNKKNKSFTVLGTKVAFVSLINVGSGFHCLRSFSFLYALDTSHVQLPLLHLPPAKVIEGKRMCLLSYSPESLFQWLCIVLAFPTSTQYTCSQDFSTLNQLTQ